VKINVFYIDPQNEGAYSKMLAIRKEVFVIEQNVAPELEYDAYEDSSYFYLATYGGKPAGVARWRFTEKGIKMERFAVLKAYRKKGVGSALLQTMLTEIAQRPDAEGSLIYLHAQVTALPLYEKFGFQAKGEKFIEADIEHYYMYKRAEGNER